MGDLAAGPRRHNSLSEVEVLPWLCCMAPALSFFSNFLAVLVTSLFFETAFYLLTAVLMCTVLFWICNLALSSFIGVFRLRRGVSTDWHALLEEVQESDPDCMRDVLHIVILPNYMENKKMLMETLKNLGRSPMAKSRVRVVLAMETREGAAGREKADYLIQATQHLFADIFATYHPEKLPGEVAGKSSNTQWAFREALRHLGPALLGCDLSRVFLTVGDADTLWHPQYLSALTYSGLTMAPEERAWRIWQPPVLLLRNIWRVPAMTRASGHATVIFELSALSNQLIFPAFAYSSYSLTLALASHPEVDGWDVDVIAEDHHMFCKCFFAALWERLQASKDGDKSPIIPQVMVEPIFLPAISYLVESTEGYWASCWARFEQARRHSQGVVELGYVLLQYSRLAGKAGIFNLPLRTHTAIGLIAFKMHILHITTVAQCFALVMATVTTILPGFVRWALQGGLTEVLEYGTSYVGTLAGRLASLDLAQQALAMSIGNISGVAVVYTVILFFVTLDLVEGRYGAELDSMRRRASCAAEMPPLKEGDDEDETKRGGLSDQSAQLAAPETKAFDDLVTGPMGFFGRLGLFMHIFRDTSTVGYPTLVCYGIIPEMLAAWSLLRRGTAFEYVVGVKPE